jgi:Zn-dependent protease with chaperone function
LTSQDEHPSGVGPVVAALSAVATGFAVVRGGWQWRRIRRQRRSLHQRHVELARLLTGAPPAAGEVLWLPAADPLAYSVAGDPPLIVLTTAVRQRLGHAAVEAVLTHERSHHARGHHLLIALAHAAAAGMGWLPLMRQSPRLVRVAVELDADADAVRRHGSHGVRQALELLAAIPAPGAALGMGGECTLLRLSRLDGRIPPGRSPIAGSTAAALVGAMWVSIAFTGVTVLASCVTA